MKAILEFDLDNYEEEQKFKQAVSASNMQSALWDISQYLRSKTKYGEYTDEVSEAYEEVKETFWEIINEYNVKLD